MNKAFIILLLSFLSFSLSAEIQFSIQRSTRPDTKLDLPLPLLEAPFNFIDNYQAPGMNQSLAITKNFYQLGHYSILEMSKEKDPTVGLFGAVAFDIVSGFVPFGDTWLHEEWHRAVLSRRKIHSFNEVYEFPLFASEIKVKSVGDHDLINLKAHHPKEQIRLSAAGMEAQSQLVLALEKEMFFANRDYFYLFPILINNLNNIFYMETCRSARDSHDSNRAAENKEGTNINERDFTGLDCLGWVYDLFRPNEPYTARGVHPSGVGVKRYIAYNDLTADEKKYLGRVTNKTWLNLVDPFMFGISSIGIKLGENAPWFLNFSLKEYMTSFGDSLDFNFFFKKEKSPVHYDFVFHHYSNFHHQFPGVETNISRIPVSLLSGEVADKLTLMARLMLWQQPDTLDVRSKSSAWGGLVGLGGEYLMSSQWSLFTRVEGKSEGWVAGNPFLEKNVAFLGGVVFRQ